MTLHEEKRNCKLWVSFKHTDKGRCFQYYLSCAYKTIILFPISLSLLPLYLIHLLVPLFFVFKVLKKKNHLYCSSFGFSFGYWNEKLQLNRFFSIDFQHNKKQTYFMLIREWIATINCSDVQHAQQNINQLGIWFWTHVTFN